MSGARALARALTADAARRGVTATVAPAGERAWRTALYDGTVHTMTMLADDDAGTAAWLAALSEAELDVGDCAVDVAVEQVVRRDGRLGATLRVLAIAA